MDRKRSDEWTLELYTTPDGSVPYADWYRRLDDYTQAVVAVAIEQVLLRRGVAIAGSSWGKYLGGGLYEFRIQRSFAALRSRELDFDSALASFSNVRRTVLIRIFCGFYGDKVVLLFNGYDKGRDASRKRQDREIRRARKMLKEWHRSS